MSNMYEGIDNPAIPVGMDRLYFGPGSYRVRLDVCKAIEAEIAFDGVASFIAECIVLQSTNPMIKPGAVVGWVNKYHKDPKKGGVARALASQKQFFAAALKADDLDVAMKTLGMNLKTFATYVSSEANPLRGVILDLVCTEKKRKDKEPITIHRWCKEGELTF